MYRSIRYPAERAGKSGFTLAECLIGICIFLLGFIPLMTMFNQASMTNQLSSKDLEEQIVAGCLVGHFSSMTYGEQWAKLSAGGGKPMVEVMERIYGSSIDAAVTMTFRPEDGSLGEHISTHIELSQTIRVPEQKIRISEYTIMKVPE